jgi:hypothetical protein
MHTILEARSGSLDALIDALGGHSLASHLEGPLRFHKIPCGFGVKPSDNVACFSPSISVFSCTYHFTDAPSACCSCQKYKWAKSANIPNSNALSEIAEHWIEN